VRAIIPLPTPAGHFDVLWAPGGTQVFKRQLKVRGFAPWASAVAVPSQGPG